MKEHTIEIRVRWGDTDKAGIIYYPNIFHYFEIGIEEFLRFHGLSYTDLEKYDVGYPRAAASAEFHTPIEFDDLLELKVEIQRVGTKSITFAFKLSRKKDLKLMATGVVTVVSVDSSTMKSTELPRELVEKLKSD